MNILDDYRKWKSQRKERVSTHSDRCHMWHGHEACMIHRLAAELESATRHMESDEAASDTSPVAIVLTDEEREAVTTAVYEAEAHQQTGRVSTLRGLLDRTQTVEK